MNSDQYCFLFYFISVTVLEPFIVSLVAVCACCYCSCQVFSATTDRAATQISFPQLRISVRAFVCSIVVFVCFESCLVLM